jgi:hypothetical protein
MKRNIGLLWASLAAHPLTLLGLVAGLATLLALTISAHDTRDKVRSIDRRVVLVERRERLGELQGATVCRTSEPRSRACVELRRLILHMPAPSRRHLAP